MNLLSTAAVAPFFKVGVDRRIREDTFSAGIVKHTHYPAHKELLAVSTLGLCAVYRLKSQG
jgi:hypothetical protein